MKAIPCHGYYAMDMMVKLTCNICPELALFNGARGVIRDIVYPAGHGYVPPTEDTVFPVVVVEFPGYEGPTLLSEDTLARLEASAMDESVDLRKLVPISAIERRCDCRRCTRRGLPLRCGKVDCVHSLQGLSIGAGEAIVNMVFHWTRAAETIWPGIFYVGTSRAKATENLVLHNQFTFQDATKIGADKRWKAQHEEVLRIHEVANSQFVEHDDDGMRLCSQNSKLDFTNSKLDVVCAWCEFTTLIRGVQCHVCCGVITFTTINGHICYDALIYVWYGNRYALQRGDVLAHPTHAGHARWWRNT